MNENNSKKPDEGRLIDYLLNESSSEERVEIERLCRENTDWQKAKKELESTLGLIEDACKQPLTGIEGGMELDSKRRKELQALRSGKDAEPVEQSDQDAETEERILIFKPAVWVPLAAAACAALLVWAPDSMDRETPEEQLAAVPKSAEKTVRNQKPPAIANDQPTLGSGELASAKSDDAQADPTVSIVSKGASLKENPDNSKEGTKLAIEEDSTIALLERRALDGANEVLNGRSASDVASLEKSIEKDAEKISLADAFARPSSEIDLLSPVTESGAPPPQPGAPAPSATSPSSVSPSPAAPLAKTVAENPAIDGIPAETSEQEPGGVGAGAVFNAEQIKELESLDESKEELARSRMTADDRLAKNKPKDLALGFKIDTDRGRELSGKGQSAERKKLATFSTAGSQKRSKPSSWTDLVRKPSSCFLFNMDGQALGEVAVTLSEGKTSVIRRMGEIRQGKRFILSPGQFELRMTDQRGSVVILSGELKRKAKLSTFDAKEAEGSSNGSSNGDYEFEAKDAWWLDQSEVRQALPVNELTR